ncbi:MAG: MOSC domain-containing protein [Chloroflexota bacterium]
MPKHPIIHSIYVGGPKTLTDERGTYESSIARDKMEGPVEIEIRGLVGDKATQPYHGGRNSAICCHAMDHYHYWNAHLDMDLQPGAVGENWTLENADEDEICIGDIYQVGTAQVQVSGPRIPCDVQGRKVGRADWVKLTLQELRTGFYLRVLEPGHHQAGDSLILQERINPEATLMTLNHCYYHELDEDLAKMFTTMTGLTRYWQDLFEKKLSGD